MPNTVKKKIRLGTLFLFLLVLISCGVGIFHLVRLKEDSNLILKNNYESLAYGHSMLSLLDSSITEPGKLRPVFDSLLRLQEANVTEPGEREATNLLRRDFEIYRGGDTSDASVKSLRADILSILWLNMSAIKAKNETAGTTADNALTYISFMAAFIFLIGFTFSLNFPSVVTGPLQSLKEGIQEISRKNYQYRIHLERKDEFGEMADAFNNMAGRLEYFENSNLNKILFEKARAEAVINSLKDASIGIDKNQHILFANNHALQLLGMQSADMVGQPVTAIKQRNDLFRFLVEEKSNLPFKIVLDGRENYFTKEMIDIEDSEAGSKLIVVRNITSFKELDVAKTNFIATISHELKTPLASSDLSLKLLNDERIGQLSAEQKELLEQLRQDNQRMLRILSELLNMSQVEAGKIQLNISAVDPQTMIGTALALVVNRAREKNISIVHNSEALLPMVMADAEKTGWVLNNFLTNAINYSSAGSTITVRASHSAKEVSISVADQGPGIAPEYHSKVFERFFKVPGSKAGGTGLGLAISKDFIEAQQGTIWIKSNPGEGSEFGFSLPTVD